jgi:hypothetical protein
MLCKKNMVLITNYRQKPICSDCQMGDMEPLENMKDPKMKKMFDIPQKLYEENSFLRDIRLKFERFDYLTERQIEVFKKVAKEEIEELKKGAGDNMPSEIEKKPVKKKIAKKKVVKKKKEA